MILLCSWRRRFSSFPASPPLLALKLKLNPFLILEVEIWNINIDFGENCIGNSFWCGDLELNLYLLEFGFEFWGQEGQNFPFVLLLLRFFLYEIAISETEYEININLCFWVLGSINLLLGCNLVQQFAPQNLGEYSVRARDFLFFFFFDCWRKLWERTRVFLICAFFVAELPMERRRWQV